MPQRGSQMTYKIPKNQEIVTRCCQQEGGDITHLICQKLFTEDNKRWILYSINEDGSLNKIAQAVNPQQLEKHIWNSEAK